jgi:putative Mn2+ efflux pump MntP
MEERKLRLIELVLIGIGLSMDAFAISIALGLSVPRAGIREIAMPGIYFGGFQALMPAVGYYAGTRFVDRIKFLDHWIALFALGIIGINMIRESFSKEASVQYSYNWGKMLVLAFATSIDAFVVGVTLAFLAVGIFRAAFVIGFVTLLICMAGVVIGRLFGARYQRKAEFFGGLVLVALGLKIFVEHVFL